MLIVVVMEEKRATWFDNDADVDDVDDDDNDVDNDEGDEWVVNKGKKRRKDTPRVREIEKKGDFATKDISRHGKIEERDETEK